MTTTSSDSENVFWLYERNKNEAKRRIKIISSNIINTILKDYKDLI